jgi:hypothetical protein
MAKKKAKTLKTPPAITPFSAMHAAVFSNHHIEPAAFATLLGSPHQWLWAGASLIRASRAVMRQLDLDSAAIMASQPGGPPITHRSPVAAQAMMLAAMACEDALKALMLAKDPKLVGATTYELPNLMKGAHDLCELATRALYIPADDDQRAALKEGGFFITWVGRYPTMTAAEDNPAGFQFHAPSLHAAYEAIFMSCADQVARLTRDPQHGQPDAEANATAQWAALETLLGTQLPADAP